MSEAELTIFQNMVLVLETLVHAGCLTYFLIYLAGMIFSIWNWLCLLLVLVILAVSSFFLDMDKKVCSLLVVLFYFLRSISGLITASLYFMFTEHFVWKETDIEVIYQYAAVGYSVDFLLSFCILAAMIFFLKKRW